MITIDIETRTIFIFLRKDIKSTEILEGYFYASMCGLYICMARRIPIVSNFKKIKKFLSLFLLLIENSL